jgi:hypothetical protein
MQNSKYKIQNKSRRSRIAFFLILHFEFSILNFPPPHRTRCTLSKFVFALW